MGSILVDLETARFLGPKSVSFYVTLDDGNERTVRFTVRADAVNPPE